MATVSDASASGEVSASITAKSDAAESVAAANTTPEGRAGDEASDIASANVDATTTTTTITTEGPAGDVASSVSTANDTTTEAHADDEPPSLLAANDAVPPTTANEPAAETKPRLSFLDLPREIRDDIYFLVLRPDIDGRPHQHCWKPWVNATGVTNVLLLNKRIYSEAIGLLRERRHVVCIHNCLNIIATPSLFRHPLDNGTPSFFNSVHRELFPLQMRIPNNISELELLRVRKFTLHVITYNRQSMIEDTFKQLVAAVSKTTQLEEILVRVRPEWRPTPNNFDGELREHWTGHPSQDIGGCFLCRALREAVNPLIEQARRGKFRLTAKNDVIFAIFPPSQPSVNIFPVDYESNALVDYINQQVQLHPPRPPVSRVDDGRLEEYVLLPECRLCYELFADRQGLEQHLRDKPTHRRPFVPEPRNVLSPRARCGGGVHVCYRCAEPFDNIDDKILHMRESPQCASRTYPVPRYASMNFLPQFVYHPCDGVARRNERSELELTFPRGFYSPFYNDHWHNGFEEFVARFNDSDVEHSEDH